MHKPIEPRLLLARLRALLRRRHGSSNTGTPCRLMHGELLIDRMQREVHLHGQPVDMGTTEFEILWLLAGQPGQILSRHQILQAVRGIGFDGRTAVSMSASASCAASWAMTRASRGGSRPCGAAATSSTCRPGPHEAAVPVAVVRHGCLLPVSVFFLNHIPDGIYTPVQDRVFVQQVRGQVYALRSGLAGRMPTSSVSACSSGSHTTASP